MDTIPTPVPPSAGARPVKERLHLDIAARTDRGRERTGNEDSYLVIAPPGWAALAVCDGMGGAAAGEVASRIAAETIGEVVAQNGAPPTRDALGFRLIRAVEEASRRVHATARARPSLHGMGTTATACALCDDVLFTAQVGDSRAYLLRDGRLTQLTRDQTLARALLENGQLRPEDVATFALGHVILQAVGTSERVEVDLRSTRVCDGDVILICSDGLHGFVDDDRIRDALAAAPTLDDACEALIALANGEGGPDNITVVVARVTGEALARPAGQPTAEKAVLAEEREEGRAVDFARVESSTHRAMSDSTAETKKAEEDAPAQIDFDHAEYAEPAGDQVRCAVCQQAIATQYWQLLGKVLCGSCREGVRGSVDQARSGAAFGKAFLLAGGAALGCGIGYAIFVGMFKWQFALVTIGIGWAVGRTIQKVTRGFGSMRHQVLAVALTYGASAMGYLPAVIGALSKNTDRTAQSAAASASTTPPLPAPSAAPADPAAHDTPPAAAPTTEEPRGSIGFGAVILALLFTGALTLAAPLLELTSGFSGILGALIMFFGLRTAWTTSKGVEAAITGPHEVAAKS